MARPPATITVTIDVDLTKFRQAVLDCIFAMSKMLRAASPLVEAAVIRHAIEKCDIPESDIRRVQIRDGVWGVQFHKWRWVATDPFIDLEEN